MSKRFDVENGDGSLYKEENNIFSYDKQLF